MKATRDQKERNKETAERAAQAQAQERAQAAAEAMLDQLAQDMECEEEVEAVREERGPRWETELHDLHTYMTTAGGAATCIVGGDANVDLSDVASS